MTFRAVSSYKGGGIYLALAVTFILFGGWLMQHLPEQAVSATLFWTGCFALLSLGLSLYLLYLAFAFFHLRYILDRNGLQIRWGGLTRRIPIRDITAIIPGHEITLPVKRFFRLPLPIWWVGTWQGVAYYTSLASPEALVVQTEQGDIVISPQDPQTFIKAWQLRLPLGPTQIWSAETLRQPLFNFPFWFDTLTWRLGGGACLLYLILVGATLTRYPTWPSAVPISSNALGQTDIIAGREQVLWFLVVGGIILLVNLILGASWYKKDRLAAYLLWSTALLVQIGLWIAIRVVVG